MRPSCSAALASSPNVTVDDTALETLADRVVAAPPAALLTETLPQALPLVWTSEAEEVGTTLLLQLLNFGSGWREELKQLGAGRCGAWETILRGVVTAHITGARLWTATGLCAADSLSVSATFGLPVDAEEEVAPGIRKTVAGPLAPFARLVARALNEAGAVLRNRGYDDFMAWLVAGAEAEARAAGEAGAHDNWRPSAVALVDRLADDFVPFRDEQLLRRGSSSDAAPPTTICLLKKAQIATVQLHRRFATRLPRLFGFQDLDKLSVGADNVLPAMLRAEGILRLAPALALSIDSGKALPPGDEEVDLRAAAVVASARLCAAIRERATAAAATACDAHGAAESAGAARSAELRRLAAICEADIDEWLWLLGKEPGKRELRRHACRRTYYY